MKRSNLGLIFAIVFIDLLGFSLILPLLPFYAGTFGATPTQVGLLVASYAAAQLVSAPLLGRMSDRFGRRPILMVSLLGTVIGFLILGFARSLWMLFFSRILDGFTGGNISVAQAYIADISDERNRARNFGLIGVAFGLGFIFGPAIGGMLSVYGFSVPAFVAALLSTLSLLGVVFLLPESLGSEARTSLAARKREEFTLSNLWQALSRPQVGPLLSIRFFFGLAFSMFQTIFPLYTEYRLGLDARSTGLVLAYVGMLVVLVQGAAIGPLTARFQERTLIVSALVLMILALFMWAITPDLAILLVVLIPLAFAGGVLNTVLNSSLSRAVYPEEIGGILGLSASLEGLTRIISPSVGGYLLGTIGAWAPGLFSALVVAGVTFFAWQRLIIRPDPPLSARL